MALPPGEHGELDRLQARIEYLEDANRWFLFAMDLLLSMREAHDEAHQGRNPAVILAGAREYLNRLLKWRTIAFFTVREEDASFLLYDCEPQEEWDWIQREVDQLIESGEFAWALNQNREVVFRAHQGDAHLVLHVLTTKSRIRGMFVGVPTAPIDELPEGGLHLISIILHHIAYVLESAELYRLLSQEKRDLEENLAARTAELQYRHTHDELTGLPNRVVLLDRLHQAIKHAQRVGGKVATLMLDVDAFKLVNDSLGRPSGDELLKQLAERLRHNLRPYDTVSRGGWGEEVTVARLGGDEFCILLPGIHDLDDVANVVQRLHQTVAVPFELAGQTFYGTCSIGVSLYPEDGRQPDTLLSQADAAMHHAKAQGRNQHQFYSPHLNSKALHHITMVSALRRALEREEFVLHFQPQIDAGGGRVAGLEALVRWQREETLVPPYEFIPVLEEDAALIIPAGEWILREAGRALLRLDQAGHPGLRMAVNLSAIQFDDPELGQRVREIIDELGLEPSRLELELTESTLTRDVERAIRTLNELHELGVRVAVDDFGTGYSSLAYLKRFPINTLKIDRSFVMDVPDDDEDTAIVRAITALAHTLNLEIVAEGVETGEQLGFLKGIGCQYIQGFLFSKPLPEPELLEFLARQGRRG